MSYGTNSNLSLVTFFNIKIERLEIGLEVENKHQWAGCITLKKKFIYSSVKTEWLMVVTISIISQQYNIYPLHILISCTFM